MLAQGQLRMTVSDDGQGFCREQTRPTSFGLVGVRERVLMLGAAWRWTASQAKALA